MSKQEEAKKEQGYESDPEVDCCGNCGYFTSTIETVKTPFGQTITKEKGLRCGLGGFAVKKRGWCRMWKPK